MVLNIKRAALSMKFRASINAC